MNRAHPAPAAEQHIRQKNVDDGRRELLEPPVVALDEGGRAAPLLCARVLSEAEVRLALMVLRRDEVVREVVEADPVVAEGVDIERRLTLVVHIAAGEARLVEVRGQPGGAARASDHLPSSVTALRRGGGVPGVPRGRPRVGADDATAVTLARRGGVVWTHAHHHARSAAGGASSCASGASCVAADLCSARSRASAATDNRDGWSWKRRRVREAGGARPLGRSARTRERFLLRGPA